MSRTDVAWRMWGDHEPYFGVATDPRFRRARFASHQQEFFDGGAALVADRLATIERLYGAADLDGTAIDFGCGVGRLSIPLAARYRRVIGIDVSPGMLREATRNCAERKVSNVQLCERVEQPTWAATDSYADRIVLVNSSFVFQHIGVRQGRMLVRRLLALLSPGGIAALHLTWDRNFPPLREIGYRVRRSVPGAQTILNVLRGRRPTFPMMEMNEYSVPDLLQIYRAAGMEQVVCEPLVDEYSIGFVFWGRKRL
jgi:cyclopropane fatty-acyl-phospholipid synthase-like methyltransferase